MMNGTSRMARAAEERGRSWRPTRMSGGPEKRAAIQGVQPFCTPSECLVPVAQGEDVDSPHRGASTAETMLARPMPTRQHEGTQPSGGDCVQGWLAERDWYLGAPYVFTPRACARSAQHGLCRRGRECATEAVAWQKAQSLARYHPWRAARDGHARACPSQPLQWRSWRQQQPQLLSLCRHDAATSQHP